MLKLFYVSYIDSIGCLKLSCVKREERRRQQITFLPETKEGRFKRIVFINNIHNIS